MKKKILITGSNGLLGQKLVHQLIPHSDQYTLLASSKGENRISYQKGYEYFSLDITDFEALNKFLVEHKPDIIINSAALTNVDACEDQTELCWKLNVDAVEQLKHYAEKENAFLLHLSTDFIFDGKDGPYDESATPNPLSYYGKSKLASEELLTKSKARYAIARTVLVYGVAEKMSRSNIVLWAINAVRSGKPLKIVNDQFRTPTLAEDLADGCVKICLLEKEGVYHLSGKDYMNVFEMVDRVADYFNLEKSQITEVSSLELGQPANRPPKTGFIIDKAINDLGYDPVSFEEGLQIVELQMESEEV
jgi:dTDP-4-dehydrorhamnose reductase